MKRLAALAGLLFVVSSASAQVWFKGTLNEAMAKAKAESKVVLIDFYSYT
ncbi:MAG: hypothetical protein ABSG19_06855 [Candidatus Aminicenantales bacterium]